ncbi:MAG: hypothetical protein H3Z51_07125 [archaeon]|nr:hypothetical protein [archaeon]
MITKPFSWFMSNFRVRVLLFVIFFTLGIVATLIGVFTPIDYASAQAIIQEVPSPSEITLLLIIENNLSIALAGFVPIIGTFWILFVLYSTGVVISAFAVMNDVSPVLCLLYFIGNPIFWIEYTGYTLAMTESAMLIYSVFLKGIREELKIALLLLIVVILLLIIGAVIEIQMLT